MKFRRESLSVIDNKREVAIARSRASQSGPDGVPSQCCPRERERVQLATVYHFPLCHVAHPVANCRERFSNVFARLGGGGGRWNGRGGERGGASMT